MQMETAYLNKPDFPIVRDHYVVISGCSGGGKSTLLSELASRGYPVVPEPGRQIVKEQLAIKGNALPWSNMDKFLDLVLSRYLLLFNSQPPSNQVTFFDRGIIDALQLNARQPEYFENAANRFRYHHRIFLVPPWEEIFTHDTERKHDFEAAKAEFEELLIKYKRFGYETVIVPKGSVEERVNFISQTLGLAPKKKGDADHFLSRAKRLLQWNSEKLTRSSDLHIEDLEELFAPAFVVRANEREYQANHQNYYAFLNRFRADIERLEYQVQEYLSSGSTVVMPLTARVTRSTGKEDLFDAIMLVKFDPEGKIIHWQEVYFVRPHS